MLMRIERDVRHAEKFALRDWFDLFNHRFLSHFYRAWEKYRFYIPYERREYDLPEPDPFTRGLFSMIGLGMPSLRRRLRVSHQLAPHQEHVLARIEDLGLLRFSGFLARRPRNAASLQVMLAEYLRVPVHVLQFQGQWLRLEPDGQSSLGQRGLNNAMGVNALIGDRVWDVQSKIRVRLGPLTYAQFVEFLPDRAPAPQRKALFLLAHLVRLYVGPEIDIEVQLILRAGEVPVCRMGKGQAPIGSRIGWNSWSRSRPMRVDAGQPVFQVRERVFLPNRSADRS
jgi:type VI secretion system protein ImpH